MADREQPYDPYIPSGGANNANAGGAGQNGNHRTAALQAVGFDMHFRYERHCGAFLGLDGHCDTSNVLRRLNSIATAITLPHNVFLHTPSPYPSRFQTPSFIVVGLWHGRGIMRSRMFCGNRKFRGILLQLIRSPVLSILHSVLLFSKELSIETDPETSLRRTKLWQPELYCQATQLTYIYRKSTALSELCAIISTRSPNEEPD